MTDLGLTGGQDGEMLTWRTSGSARWGYQVTQLTDGKQGHRLRQISAPESSGAVELGSINFA